MARSARRRGAQAGSRRGPILVGVTVVLGLFALFTVLSLTAARRDLTAARADLVAARGAVAHRDNDAAKAALATGQRRLASAQGRSRRLPLLLLRPIPVLGALSRATEGASRAGLEGVAAARTVLTASEDFPTSGQSGLSGEDLSAFHTAATKSRGALLEANAHLESARSALAGPAGAALPLVARPARAMRTEIRDAERQLEGVERGLTLLADLTGPTADVRLLVLSQDSLELRPTGGYIGSYGVLQFRNGTARLETFAATEDLPAPVPPLEPPADLGRWLPKHWGVSNANWWPDFPTSARTARELFQRQGQGEVDGVLAITEYATARMIGAVGPLKLPSYEKPVVEKGFDERAIYELELKRPLDTPRKKFLIELSDGLFDRLLHLPADRLPTLSQAVSHSVGAGDIQLWFNEPARQAQIADSVVAGRLPAAPRDFLMLVDANLTASKANIGLTKHATYRVERDDEGRLMAHLEVLVRNDADADDNLNPYYNGFLRVYSPLGSTLSTQRDGQTDDGPAADGPYQVFSQALDVNPKESQTVVFDYQLPPGAAPDWNYSLTWARQAGTPRDSLSVVVGGTSTTMPAEVRSLSVTESLRGNRVAEWMRQRWIFRKLGI